MKIMIASDSFEWSTVEWVVTCTIVPIAVLVGLFICVCRKWKRKKEETIVVGDNLESCSVSSEKSDPSPISNEMNLFNQFQSNMPSEEKKTEETTIVKTVEVTLSSSKQSKRSKISQTSMKASKGKHVSKRGVNRRRSKKELVVQHKSLTKPKAKRKNDFIVIKNNADLNKGSISRGGKDSERIRHRYTSPENGTLGYAIYPDTLCKKADVLAKDGGAPHVRKSRKEPFDSNIWRPPPTTVLRSIDKAKMPPNLKELATFAIVDDNVMISTKYKSSNLN